MVNYDNDLPYRQRLMLYRLHRHDKIIPAFLSIGANYHRDLAHHAHFLSVFQYLYSNYYYNETLPAQPLQLGEEPFAMGPIGGMLVSLLISDQIQHSRQSPH